MAAFLRRGLIVVLLGAVVFGAWQYANGKDPMLDAEQHMKARLAEYVKLRYAEDWSAIYQMTDPEQRRTVDLPTFLAAYGHGVARTKTLDPLSLEIDRRARTAQTTLFVQMELVLENLPAGFRNVRMPDDPADLLQSGNPALAWVWRDGEWYLRIDDYVGANDATGKQVVPLDER